MTYLDSTPNGVYCMEVDREHRKKGNRSPFPQLCFCFDTFWYFYLGFDFVIAKPMSFPIGYNFGFIVGIKKVGNGFAVKLLEKDHQIENEEDQTAFYDSLYNATKDDLSSSWTKAPKVFGFTK